MSLIVISVAAVIWVSMLISYKIIKDSRRYITASWGFLALYALYCASMQLIAWWESSQVVSERQVLAQAAPNVSLSTLTNNPLSLIVIAIVLLAFTALRLKARDA